MKRLTLTILLFISFSATADVVTFRFSSVWAARDTFMQTCLYSLTSCSLTPQEIRIAQTMLQNSPQEKELSFVSGQQNPLLFGGAVGIHNVVGTRPQVGAQVYVNTDTLYQNGYGASYNFAMAYAIAVWAFHNQYPWLASQVLGQKLVTYWSQQSQLLSLASFGIRNMELQIFASPYRGAVLMIDEAQGTDLSPIIEKQLPCSGNSQVIGLQEVAGAGWSQFATQGDTVAAVLAGQISFACGQGGRPLEHWTAQMQLSMDFDKSANGISLNPGTVKIHLLNVVPNSN